MNKLLVANRGEIAIRIMRTAREMGLHTVAVYSEADRHALHVRYADEAFCIGPPPSSQSYLLGDRIIEVACRCGAEAIHPGYGFLSENAAFAEAVQQSGLLFIGPPASAMRQMGSKLAAKATARRLGVPLVPGTEQPIADVEAALQEAKRIGFPILIKASAGGGGKGMRLVEDEKQFADQVQRAISEAQAAFGDGSVFMEKYVSSPRHIEIQLIADQHGNCCYLFERECSIQRRHQKVIEEAPSSILTDAMRQRMGRDAVALALATGYTNAGTVEFLVDASASDAAGNMPYYFLEMNTRLQVEHPVTELITGVDLVREQICVACGEPLSFSQQDLRIHGHAIELRVCAEDPANHFLPDIGTLHTYRKPEGPGIRVDDAYEAGMEIPIHYDPMLAKLIVHAGDRQSAIARMIRAIDEYEVSGVQTTLPFGRWVMQHPAFRSGRFDTHFISEHFSAECLQADVPDAAATALLAALIAEGKTGQTAHPAQGIPSASGDAWRRRLRRRQ
ncbi:MAG: acetyl-CoA carboxylase biotin carboxylase subunit [Chitinophagales bacterium]|nr:acetyl-CoA carboxylase biotin carboxylase subunit [Chitinophagales bacterium]